jgi:3-dehydrosphinganine reductase
MVMKSNVFSQKHVLITGGSSGIGLAVAKQFVQKGAHVHLFARREQALEEARLLLEEYRFSPDQVIHTISMDVSSSEQVTRQINALAEKYGAPDILINSAGITYPGHFQDLGLEIFEEIIRVNYLGCIYMCKAVAKGMISRGSGVIVNISSLVSVVPLYGYSAYAPSKSAIYSFSDVLRSEMSPYGIHVATVLPGDVRTPQLEFETPLKPHVTRTLARLANVIPAEKVAQDILDGISRKKTVIIPGFDASLIYHLRFLLGGSFMFLLDLLIAWLLKSTNSSQG